MTWTEPLYSRGEVKRAGRAYVDGAATPEERELAHTVIDNWRSAHSYPLNTFQIRMRTVAPKFDSDPLVAQRIKRLPSIRHKLERFPGFNVAQMQDLGGCRAVMSSVEQVDQVVEYYLNKSRSKHPLIRHDAYIDHPKDSGYRGVHLVYAYRSDKVNTWDGLKVELQIRTRLQHAWATAVETVGTFTQQALKSSQGEDEWLHFFALMGSAHAIREGRPLVPNTPTGASALRAAITEAAKQLDVINKLTAYGQTLRVLADKESKDKMFLLELKAGPENELTVRGFDDVAIANAEYSALESATEQESGTDVVLVSVQSLAALQRAYPNYFLDTGAFLDSVREAMA